MIYFFASFLLIAGAYHFINPDFYNPFMPDWFPKRLANSAAGVVELLIGLLLFIPSQKSMGLWLALGLMVVFLPLHILDLLKEQPAIGSKGIAVFRLVLQFILIGWLILEIRC